MDVCQSYQSTVDYLDASSNQNSHEIFICQSQPFQPKNPADEIPSGAVSPIVQRTIEYIEKHYAEGVSMKEFSAALNINTAYLGYLFKKETGTFFNNYLNDIRLQKAAELLCTGKDRISDIAAKTAINRFMISIISIYLVLLLIISSIACYYAYKVKKE